MYYYEVNYPTKRFAPDPWYKEKVLNQMSTFSLLMKFDKLLVFQANHDKYNSFELIMSYIYLLVFEKIRIDNKWTL